MANIEINKDKYIKGKGSMSSSVGGTKTNDK